MSKTTAVTSSSNGANYRACYAIGKKAHKGQLYAGKPYFSTHVQPLVDYFRKRKMWDEACLAALHDVVEDHGHKLEFSYARLSLLGVPRHVSEALRHISKEPAESYTAYIERCMLNNLAWRVKIRDVLQNISYDPNRYRVQKYAAALLLLTAKCPENVLKP